MIASAPEPTATGWIGQILGILGALGGLGGIGAMLTILIQRRKYNAQASKLDATAADQITDTALILVKPLRERVRELEQEVATARGHTSSMLTELGELRMAVREAVNTLLFWRSRILEPTATIEGARLMVTTMPSLPRNGARLVDRGD